MDQTSSVPIPAALQAQIEAMVSDFLDAKIRALMSEKESFRRIQETGHYPRADDSVRFSVRYLRGKAS